MKTYIAIFIVFIIIIFHNAQAQFPFDPLPASHLNGIIGQWIDPANGATMSDTINIHFDDTTLWAIHPKQFMLGHQWGVGMRALNARLHMNAYNEKFNNSAPSYYLQQALRRVNNPYQYISYNNDRLDMIGYSPSMQWDPESPLNDSQEQWVAEESDTTGACYGFRLKYGGTIIGEHYALSVAGMDTNGQTVLSNIEGYKDFADGGNIHYINKSNQWYFAINLRRADTLFQSDTTDPIVLKIRIPIKYVFKDPDTSYIVNSFIKFDSLLIDSIGNTAQVEYYPRARWMDSKLVIANSDSVIIIRRSMLPKFSDTCDVTLSVFFKVKSTSDDSTTPNPPFRRRGINEIDSFDIRVEYFPTCNIKINWLRMESPKARTLFRGQLDTAMAALITFGIIEHVKAMQDSIPNVRLWRMYSSDEVTPIGWRYMRYFNKLVNNTLHCEGPFGNRYRHLVQPANSWIGSIGFHQTSRADYFKYSYMSKYGYMSQKNAEYTLLSPAFADGAGNDIISFVSSYPCGHFYATPDGLSNNGCTNPKWSDSAFKQRYNTFMKTPGKSSQIEINANIRSINTDILFKDSWLAEIWTLQEYIGTYNRNNKETRNIRYNYNNPQTGEQIRYSTWSALCLGAKGIMYDRFHADELRDTSLTDTLSNYQESPAHIGCTGINRALPMSYLNNEQNGDAYLHNDYAVGGDFVVHNDVNKLDQYINFNDFSFKTSISPHRFYVGRKSMRLEVCKLHDFIYRLQDTLMKLELMGWYGKQIKPLKVARNNNIALLDNIFSFNSSRLMTIPTARPTLRDGWDTTYLDITLLRHKDTANIPMTKEFYVGIINRRTNPLIRNSQTGDTLQFFSTAEFDSLTTGNNSFWQQQRYKQGGARMVTLPFNVQASDNHYALLRVTELGADDVYLDSVYAYRNNPALYQKIDTVIGQDKSVMVKLLPGEGKIFRVRVQYPDRFTGDLAHSNQTKLVAHNIMRHDSVQNKWVEGDSVVYHCVYHKEIPNTMKRKGVYYRVSKPMADY